MQNSIKSIQANIAARKQRERKQRERPAIDKQLLDEQTKLERELVERLQRDDFAAVKTLVDTIRQTMFSN